MTEHRNFNSSIVMDMERSFTCSDHQLPTNPDQATVFADICPVSRVRDNIYRDPGEFFTLEERTSDDYLYSKFHEITNPYRCLFD